MKRAVRIIFAVTGLAFASAPAAARELPLGASVAPRNASYSKSEAILGGAPSSLAAILASQGAARNGAPSPAGYGAPGNAQAASMPRVVPLDRPDVFGSVALAVGATPLERRWSKVERKPIGPAAAAFVNSLSGLNEIEQLDAVNRFVNARVQFTNDKRQFGSTDLWLAAGETLRRGRGDCEDFAIAKLQMLRHAGFADKDLYLVILYDVRRRQDHAVLVARAEGRLLVLDNGTSRIVDSDSIADYRPILSFSGDRSWTHGYRRGPEANVQYAEARPAIEFAPAAEATDKASPVVVSIAF
jgi:predicted transglutaminase-like cysteine proteinase